MGFIPHVHMSFLGPDSQFIPGLSFRACTEAIDANHANGGQGYNMNFYLIHSILLLLKDLLF
jgi:hypothetical protein